MGTTENNVVSLRALQFEVVRLKFGNGYSLGEIAQKLRLNLRTIQKLIELTLRKEFIKEEI